MHRAGVSLLQVPPYASKDLWFSLHPIRESHGPERRWNAMAVKKAKKPVAKKKAAAKKKK
jgi:hypothetical protein